VKEKEASKAEHAGCCEEGREKDDEELNGVGI
jgi:hypothetical protein